MAIISATLAAGSVTSPYFYQVNVTETLCKNSCSEATPDFKPVFALVSYSNVGKGQYMATVSCSGVICYIPCGGGACCTKSQLVSQLFTIPFYSEDAPESVILTQGVSVNAISVKGCQSCGNVFVSETPLSLDVVTAAAASDSTD
jgi:hypothetical protein